MTDKKVPEAVRSRREEIARMTPKERGQLTRDRTAAAVILAAFLVVAAILVFG